MSPAGPLTTKRRRAANRAPCGLFSSGRPACSRLT